LRMERKSSGLATHVQQRPKPKLAVVGAHNLSSSRLDCRNRRPDGAGCRCWLGKLVCFRGILYITCGSLGVSRQSRPPGTHFEARDTSMVMGCLKLFAPCQRKEGATFLSQAEEMCKPGPSLCSLTVPVNARGGRGGHKGQTAC
jgi:hypothetical protein